MKGKLLGYFVHKGFYSYRRGWYKGTCLYCGSDDKAGVNPSRDFYHCFVCEEKGTMLNVMKDIENFPNNVSAFKALDKLEEIPVPKPKKVDRMEVPESVLPEGFINIRRGDSKVSERAREYIVNKRGIPLEIAAKAGTGYVDLKESDYFGSIIFPMIENTGKVKSFQGRRFLSMEPRFLNPKIEEVGVGKTLVLYNEKALYNHKEVNVVESAINALTIWPNAIAGSGKAFSNWQRTKIIKSPVEVLNLLLDSDAFEYSVKLARYFLPLKKVRLIKMPDSKDVNDIGRSETFKIINKTPVLASRMELDRYLYESGYRKRSFRMFT